MVGKAYPSSTLPLPAGTVPYPLVPPIYAELILVILGVRECPGRDPTCLVVFVAGGGGGGSRVFVLES